MSETVSPWSAEGYEADKRRDRISRRRERIAEMSNAGYGGTLISEKLGIPKSTVDSDIQRLREQNLINPARKMSKFNPTDAMIIQLCTLLRQDMTYQKIGEEFEVSSGAIQRFINKSKMKMVSYFGN